MRRQTSSTTNKRPIPRERNISSGTTRYRLTMAITGLVILLALIAVYNQTAGKVLDQILPLLMLILGSYFGQKQ
jgi:hypothetical protein